VGLLRNVRKNAALAVTLGDPGRRGSGGSPLVAAAGKPQARQPHRGIRIMTNATDFTPQASKPTKRKVAIGVATVFALAAVSGGIAACGGGTTTTLVPGPTTTRTVPAAPVKVKAAPVKAAASAPSTPAPVATQPAAAPASSTPASMTSSEQQAVDAAQGYLNDGEGFSAYSLLNQLTSSYGSSFSQSDAQFAISYLSPDWDAQAVDAAKGYVNDGSGFSTAGLTQQLTSDYGNGFTPLQAEYAVAQVMPGSAAAAPASAAQPSAPSAQSGAPGGPAPQAPVPGTTDPWTVVSQYYANIESQDYTDAWALQSPDFQASNGSLAGWSAGYADAGAETLTENSESGDTVSFNLSAVDTATGSTQQFACSFTVDPTSGLITSGACTQTG
jgi:hypothetical protein